MNKIYLVMTLILAFIATKTLANTPDSANPIPNNVIAIEGTNAEGEPESTIIDANGNLKVVEPNPSATTAKPPQEAQPATQEPAEAMPPKPDSTTIQPPAVNP